MEKETLKKAKKLKERIDTISKCFSSKDKLKEEIPEVSLIPLQLEVRNNTYDSTYRSKTKSEQLFYISTGAEMSQSVLNYLSEEQARTLSELLNATSIIVEAMIHDELKRCQEEFENL